VLLTSLIDKYWHHQQFSAPFKAGNSRQVQTCNIPYIGNTKEITTWNWFTLVQEKWGFLWPWFIMRCFEDKRCQARAIFTMMLSFDIFISFVNQFHYHIAFKTRLSLLSSAVCTNGYLPLAPISSYLYVNSCGSADQQKALLQSATDCYRSELSSARSRVIEARNQCYTTL